MEGLEIASSVKTVENWDRELGRVVEPSWFDTIVSRIEESGAVVENVLERRKECYLRLIRGNTYGTRNLWRKRYEEDFGEPCPIV